MTVQKKCLQQGYVNGIYINYHFLPGFSIDLLQYLFQTQVYGTQTPLNLFLICRFKNNTRFTHNLQSIDSNLF